MKKSQNNFLITCAIFVVVLLSVQLNAQDNRKINGVVIDATSGESLIGATIRTGNAEGTVTNTEGKFQLNLSEFPVVITVTYVGYESKLVRVFNSDDLRISLQSNAVLAAITISGTKPRTRELSPVPVQIIPISDIISQAAQTDVNQIIQYTNPSFQSVRQTISDGTDHIDPASLRGMGSDQVLVLINGKRMPKRLLLM